MIKLPKFRNTLTFFQYGLFLFILLIPFADFSRMSVFVSKILPVRILLGILFIAGFWVLVGALRKKTITLKQVISSLYKDPVFVSLVLLWVIRGISIFRTLNIKNSLELYLFYTAMLGLYVLMREVFKRSRFYVITATRLYVYTAVVIGFYGLFQYLFFKITNRALPGVLVGGDYIRLPATFYDANHFAAYIAMVAPLIISFAWLSKKIWQSVFWWVTYFIITYVVLYSFSRSGLLALATGTLSILIIGLWRGYYRKILPLLGAIALAVIVVIVSNATGRSLLDRAKSIFDLHEPSTLAHYLLLKGEVELFAQNPVFGIGYGSFAEKFRATATGQEHAKVDTATDIHIPAHSVWFEVVTETGLVGLGAYLLFVVLLFRSLLRLIRFSGNKTIKIYASGLFSGAVGVWSGGIFYSYNLEFFWFFLFLAYLFARVTEGLIADKSILPDGDEKEKLNWAEIIPATAVVVIGAFLIFKGLGNTTLISAEATLAAVAKDLYRLPNWFIPLAHGIPYFSHPPLYEWLTTTIVHLYGPRAIAARFVPAIAGVITILLTYLIGRRFLGITGGFLAACFLLIFTPFMYLSRSVNVEILVVGLSLFAFYLLTFYRKHLIFKIAAIAIMVVAAFADLVTTFLMIPIILVFIRMYLNPLWRDQDFWKVGAVSWAVLTLPWPIFAFYHNADSYLRSFLQIPNPSFILPVVALLLANFTLGFYRELYRETHLPEKPMVRYILGLVVLCLVFAYNVLPGTTKLTTPPDTNKNLVALLTGAEYQERVKMPLYLDGMSPEVVGFYTDGVYKSINYIYAENIIGENRKQSLVITSAVEGARMLDRFGREGFPMQKVDQSGNLVLLVSW